jgi:hypothetical protein
MLGLVTAYGWTIVGSSGGGGGEVLLSIVVVVLRELRHFPA